jgi:tetratricopeptide (TPR) repeat protein
MALIGEFDRVAELYPLAVQAAETGKIFRGWDYRLIKTVAGVAAACAGRLDEAETWLREAVTLADELPYVSEQPEARRFLAWVLIRRGREGDADHARELLDDALERYVALGMSGHERLVREMLVAL